MLLHHGAPESPKSRASDCNIILSINRDRAAREPPQARRALLAGQRLHHRKAVSGRLHCGACVARGAPLTHHVLDDAIAKPRHFY
jgi:hypothetical protein